MSMLCVGLEDTAALKPDTWELQDVTSVLWKWTLWPAVVRADAAVVPADSLISRMVTCALDWSGKCIVAEIWSGKVC